MWFSLRKGIGKLEVGYAQVFCDALFFPFSLFISWEPVDSIWMRSCNTGAKSRTQMRIVLLRSRVPEYRLFLHSNVQHEYCFQFSFPVRDVTP